MSNKNFNLQKEMLNNGDNVNINSEPLSALDKLKEYIPVILIALCAVFMFIFVIFNPGDTFNDTIDAFLKSRFFLYGLCGFTLIGLLSLMMLPRP